MTPHRIAVLPGDGIGPEVMKEALKVLEVVSRKHEITVAHEEYLVGGAALDATNNRTPLPPETLEGCEGAEAILFGSVGGPRWEDLPPDIQPERGALLPLRKHFGLFANLRPGVCHPALIDASPVKNRLIPEGFNVLCVRELTGGIYFGEPRGIKPINNGERKGINTHTYTSTEIQRVGRIAFELAKKRNNKVTSCEKSNVMEAGQLWKEEIQTLHDKDFKDVQLEHMLADNCAMQLLRNPKQFDVIVTDNLFGDILSDEAAMLTGSLGLLPSASLGAKDKDGNMRSMYEPVHGSAPDIAGKGLANPIATILSFAMALKYSLNLDKEAKELENCLLYTSPSPRDRQKSRMPSSA